MGIFNTLIIPSENVQFHERFLVSASMTLHAFVEYLKKELIPDLVEEEYFLFMDSACYTKSGVTTSDDSIYTSLVGWFKKQAYIFI